MDKGSYVAVSGSLAQERAMETISNNLANLNTAGFKADRMMFESYLQRSMQAAPASPQEAAMRSGEPVSGDSEFLTTSQSYTDFSQGALRNTGQKFDFALEGSGFFAVLTGQGERFTRGGNFAQDAEGRLVTKGGHLVLDEHNNPIYTDNKDFHVDEDGTMWDKNNRYITRMKVVDFEDKTQLKKTGEGLYEATDTSTGKWSEAKVLNGWTEGSNLNAVSEMTKMITALRSYQTFQKAIQSQDEMTSRLINDVGR